MDDMTQIPSRLGQFSVIISVLNLLVSGTFIVIRLNVPDSWMDTDDLEQIERTARLVFLGNWAIALFILITLVGLTAGIIAYFQSNTAKFYSILGFALNSFNLLLWFGLMIYLFPINANRFRL
jgi:hypothetical protein